MDLSTRFCGLELQNPFMPASGPLTGDARKMLALADFGLGAMVSKTISREGAIVPRPCIYGEKNFALNAELWSEYPAETWIENFLPAYAEAGARSGGTPRAKRPLLLSVGYTAEDIAAVVPRLEPFADAYEVSTHYVGKNLDPIAETVRTLRGITEKPFFMKLSPHLPDPVAFARRVLENGANGVVAINSLGPTIQIDAKNRRLVAGNGAGEVWMSGPVIKPLALALVHRVKTELPECVVIGTGGVANALDVVEFLLAGADAVQMLSAALIRGKDLYRKILDDLPTVLSANGFSSVAEVLAQRAAVRAPRWEPNPPVFDHLACTRCRLCEKVCPYFAIDFDGEARKMTVDPAACFGCGLCETRCPVGAISGVLD